MEEPRARGMSLWLMPAGDAHDRLARLIVSLAARFSTPPFPPHVTLLAGIEGRPEDEALGVSRVLAAALPPLFLRLLTVDGRAEPFRCLFAPAEASAPLLAAHAAAARAFGREPDPGFLPHLSLVYGALPEPTKRALAAEVADLVARPFPAARLHAWRTEGRVGDWRELGTFELGGT